MNMMCFAECKNNSGGHCMSDKMKASLKEIGLDDVLFTVYKACKFRR